MSTLILHVLQLHVIIVISQTMKLILVCYLVDHTDYRHWLLLMGSFTCIILLKTDLSVGSSIAEVRTCEDFDVRSKESIPLGHDFHDDKHFNDREEASDLSSALVVVPL